RAGIDGEVLLTNERRAGACCDVDAAARAVRGECDLEDGTVFVVRLEVGVIEKQINIDTRLHPRVRQAEPRARIFAVTRVEPSELRVKCFRSFFFVVRGELDQSLRGVVGLLVEFFEWICGLEVGTQRMCRARTE